MSGRRPEFAFFPSAFPLLQSNIFRYLEFTEDYVWSTSEVFIRRFERITQQHDHECRRERERESKRVRTAERKKKVYESAFP